MRGLREGAPVRLPVAVGARCRPADGPIRCFAFICGGWQLNMSMPVVVLRLRRSISGVQATGGASADVARVVRASGRSRCTICGFDAL